jgi:uncharacterized protein
MAFRDFGFFVDNTLMAKSSSERLAEVVCGQGGQKCFVTDEIQKVPELLSVIHQLIEEKQGYTFVLTD